MLDFDELHGILARWPSMPPESSVDGVFSRIGQILSKAAVGVSSIGQADLPPLLRQVMRRQSHRTGHPARLRVPATGDWPTRDRWAEFGIRAQSISGAQFLIEAMPWSPSWMSDPDVPVFEDAYGEREVRLDWSVAIDPFLEAASGFGSYVSPGQREAVRSAFLIPAGETLIVSLPTGSGKSFVAQAPTLVRGLEGGLTICVVPTTALALDQARQTTELLRLRHPRRRLPALAWHAGLSEHERNEIRTAIREGRQGILFCSPEAVTRGLLAALYDAARDGLIAYLVVDEAHLVSQWGDGFRPAFQMLAGVRRGLLAACASEPFRTILMSATLAPETVETIDALFGPATSVQMIASIYLRPEPQYWIHRENDRRTKDDKILEAVRHAPRPFILYVTKREDARRWFSMLRRAGYLRTECFYGETPDAERARIIDEWAANRIDGIVATSAFGVGIDKRDVRAVIHAAVPETIDRFYQEVGRGGRDGRTSASLLIYSSSDRETADTMNSPGLIGEELAFERWSSMFAASKPLDPTGSLLEIDLDTVPPRLRQQSDYNAAWNMRTLIMMARAGLLDLESRPPEKLSRDDNEDERSFESRSGQYWESYFRRVIVRMHSFAHRDQAYFDGKVAEERLRSSRSAFFNRELLDELTSGETEVSLLLDRLYRSHAPGRSLVVARACGGCPVHRRLGAPDLHYGRPIARGIERVDPFDPEYFRERFPHVDVRAPVIVPLPDQMSTSAIVELLEDLVGSFGVMEIAISEQFRKQTNGVRRLHTRSRSGILLVQSLEDERFGHSSYRLARATVLSGGKVPMSLLLMDRPLHVLLAPMSMQDPFNAGRLLMETGTNVLPLDLLKIGARA